MRIVGIIGAVFLIWIAASCSNTEEEVNPDAALFSALVSDARSVFVASNPGGRTEEGNGSYMYKETPSGEVLKVTFTNEEGEDVTERIQATAIYPLGADHVLFLYQSNMEPNNPNPAGGLSSAVVINTADNQVYAMPHPPTEAGGSNPTPQRIMIQKDAQGHFYWTSLDKIIKVNLSNYSYETFPQENPASFLVNGEGAFYFGSKIKLTTGGYHYLPTGQDLLMIGLNRDFIYSTANAVMRLQTSGGEVTEHFVAHGFINVLHGIPYISANGNRMTKVSDDDITVLQNGVDTVYTYSFDEFEEPGIRLWRPQGQGSAEIPKPLSDDAFVFAGSNAGNQPIFCKITLPEDPNSHLMLERLVPDGEYEVHDFSCNQHTGEIAFYGLRASDGVMVSAWIDANGTVQITSENDQRGEVQYMTLL